MAPIIPHNITREVRPHEFIVTKTRLEQFGEGSLVHIIHRGTRGTEIVREESDKWHFLVALYFLNDKATDQHWRDNINLNLVRSDLTKFECIRKNLKKTQSNKRETYVDILAYCLMPNHFHLLIFVKEPEDVGRFMQRLCTSLAMRFNKKYKTTGGLFESRYKISVIKNELHLNIVMPYITFKNPCELLSGGLKSATKDPNTAFKFAVEYPFSSLGDLVAERIQSDIINKNRLYESIEIPKSDSTIKKWCIHYLKDRLSREAEIDYVLG